MSLCSTEVDKSPAEAPGFRASLYLSVVSWCKLASRVHALASSLLLE